MNLFTELAAMTGSDITTTIVIKHSGSKMTVCTNFTTVDGSVDKDLTPFILKGTSEELDNGFLEALKAPIETINGLVSNIEAFKKAAKNASENASKNLSVKNVQPANKNSDSDKTNSVAEKKKLVELTMTEAKNEMGKGNFYTAEALFKMADAMTVDKKTKNEITKNMPIIEDGKIGFLCSDDEMKASETIEEFKKKIGISECSNQEIVESTDDLPEDVKPTENKEEEEPKEHEQSNEQED